MPRYVILPHPTPRPSDLASARRYSELADAFADMAQGVILDVNRGEIVAFHERHLRLLEARGHLGLERHKRF